MLRLPQYQKVMKIEPGKYFEIAYKLFRVNPDGTETLMHEVSAEEPDRAIFDYTCRTLGIKPEETLFFDDSEANTVAAKELGFNTAHVRPGTELTDYLP